MNRILHILTRENDPIAAGMVHLQREQEGAELVVIDLTREPVDYPLLLRKIFEADSVEVW